MTNMHALTDLADHASRQDDRWLLVAILIIGIAGMLMFWRWIVADREKVADRLANMTDRHIDSQAKLSEVVVNNTTALREVREVIVYCKGGRHKPD
jgi:hypothetical protein